MTDIDQPGTSPNSSSLVTGKPPTIRGARKGLRTLTKHPVNGSPGRNVTLSRRAAWAEQAVQTAATVVCEVPGPQDLMVISKG